MTRPKVLVVVLLVIAASLALAPVSLYLGRPLAVPVIAAVAVIVAAMSVRKMDLRGSSPTIGESLVALASVAGEFALIGAIWLLYYVSFYWLVRLGNRYLDLGWSAHWWGYAIGAGLSLPVFIAYAARSGQRFAHRLYPEFAGVPSPFREMLALGRRRLLTRLFTNAIGAAAFSALWQDLLHHGAPYIAWFAFVLTYGLDLRPSDLERTSETASTDLIKQIGALLERKGYSVLANPRTGRELVDPLLSQIDLFASAGSYSLLIDIKKLPKSSAPVRWPTATTCVAAAAALPHEDLPSGVSTIAPVLVLLDAKPAPDLASFASEHSLFVWQASSDGEGKLDAGLEGEIDRTAKEISMRSDGKPAPPAAVAPKDVSGA